MMIDVCRCMCVSKIDADDFLMSGKQERVLVWLALIFFFFSLYAGRISTVDCDTNGAYPPSIYRFCFVAY